MQQPIRRARPSDPPWVHVALQELGVTEVPAHKHNPRIVEYHARTTLSATDDETPWCSSFLCWAMEESGLTSTSSAASLSWLRWGRELTEPRRGCIVVLERSDANGNVLEGRGHCGIWMGETPENVLLLGGNQGNTVGIDSMAKHRVISYRWPTRPYNSTTNIASVGVGAATAVSVAPTAFEMLGKLSENKDTVDSLLGHVGKFITTLMSDTQGALQLGGAVVAVLGVLWIMRERNKKIRKWGI